MMAAAHRLASAISRFGALAGGILLLMAAVLIGFDIILRAGFSRTIGGADELSGYALAIATAWGLSFAALNRAHIRIDSLYERCPSWLRAMLDLLSLVGFIVFAGLVSWYALGVLIQSVASGTRSISALAVPLVIPQAFWVVGLAFLMLVLLLLLVEALIAWARKDAAALARLIGAKAVQEEIKEEVDQAAPGGADKRGSP